MRQSAKTPTALGCAIYAGGFTLGIDKHFHVKAVLEETPYGVNTARHNFPHIPIYVGQENWPIGRFKSEPAPDLIYGNPPCAAWSINGKKGDWAADVRVQCTERHFDLLRELKPKIWVWESVVRAFEIGRSFVDDLTREAMRLGYSVTYLLHDAQYCGAPQVRRRFFMIAHTVTLSLPSPSWTKVSAADVLKTVKPMIYSDHRKTEVTLFPPSVLSGMKPGERLNKLWERHNPESDRTIKSNGQVKGRPSFGHVRLPLEGPCGATVGYHMVHPTEHRWLAVNEIQALAGFPQSYVFKGSGELSQIARGVTPYVAEWLSGHLRKSLKLAVPIAKPAVHLVDYRSPHGLIMDLPEPQKGPSMPRPAPAPPVTPPATAKPPSPAGIGSGARIRQLLQEGLHTDAILSIIHREFPGSKAGPSDVSWNKGKLKKAGVDPFPLGGPPAPGGPFVAPVAPRQPTTSKREVADRSFDQTNLNESYHGRLVHRDYIAHVCRWGFAGRFINSTIDVLDVGCGPDCALAKSLILPRGVVPKSYLGVDLNSAPKSYPGYAWSSFKWDFNFIARHNEIKQTFNLITCFEVIEHMAAADGLALMVALRKKLAPGGTILLSTPVFSGKAAANHIHEYTVPELANVIKTAKLKVVKRFGTFAKIAEIRKVASAAELDIMNRIGLYYGNEVLATFLAPLYPDVSSNNVWNLNHG